MNIPTSSSLIPAPQRRHRRRKLARPASPAPVAPVLNAVSYDPSISVDLTFDQAVDISGFFVTELILDDFDDTHTRYRGTGTATLVSPTVVRVALVAIGLPEGDLIRLTVGPSNGIRSDDDGVLWGGVSELPVPYP